MRFSVVARHSAFLAIAIVKIFLILSDAPLIAFAWAALSESVLAAIALVMAYGLNRHRIVAWLQGRTLPLRSPNEFLEAAVEE